MRSDYKLCLLTGKAINLTPSILDNCCGLIECTGNELSAVAVYRIEVLQTLTLSRKTKDRKMCTKIELGTLTFLSKKRTKDGTCMGSGSSCKRRSELFHQLRTPTVLS